MNRNYIKGHNWAKNSPREICPICKSSIKDNFKGYCSKECMNVENTRKHRIYVNKNKDRVSKYNIKQHSEIRAKWGSLGQENNYEKSTIVEDYIINELALYPEELGFSNIFKINRLNRFFTGDLIATKDNRNCIVEITGCYAHLIKLHKQICKRLDLDLYLIFVKPDLSAYIIKKVDLDTKYNSLCLTRKKVWSM